MAKLSAKPRRRDRGQIVVCVVVQSPPDSVALCLRSVVAHTPADVPILIAEVENGDPAITAIVKEIADGPGARHELVHLLPSKPAANLVVAVATAAPADLAMVWSDCEVGPGWCEALRRAAYSDSQIASASALSNNAGALSVCDREARNQLPSGLDAESASAAVAERALRLYPRLPTAVGRATYLRRDALELVGGFDASFHTCESALVDVCQRCVASGLTHVAADDVFVVHQPAATGLPTELARDHDTADAAIIAARYPYYSAEAEVKEAPDRPLPTVIARARFALNPVSVTIDARCLEPPLNGTFVTVLETIRAVAALDVLRLRIVVPPNLDAVAKDVLAELDVSLLRGEEDLTGVARTDIAHRPFQVSSAADLHLLGKLGERTVITHPDLIGYDNPSYFPSFTRWREHRELTRIALAFADRVVFVSRDVADEAIAEQLIVPEQAVVTHQGITYSYSTQEPHPPAGVELLGDRPFMVVIGADYHHKNRVFALELLAAMREGHGWPGGLVLAGPRMPYGSSAGEEARFLLRNPDLASAVVTLPAISEPEKAWLLDHAVAVCHPSTREGFGLVPFEAAAHDRPCVFASTTSLSEVQPEGLATIVPWNAQDSAQGVMGLLGDRQRIDDHIRRINERARELSWQTAAEKLVSAYEGAVSGRTTEVRRVASELVQSEARRGQADHNYGELWSALSADGHMLVGPQGLLDADDQRALLIVATRPLMRRIVLGQARLLRRLKRHPAPLPAKPTTPPELFDLHFREANRERMGTDLAPPADLEAMH